MIFKRGQISPTMKLVLLAALLLIFLIIIAQKAVPSLSNSLNIFDLW